MAHYDPDRMTADDLDPYDQEMVQEYLDHPNTAALHDDLGRAFRALPPAEQIPEVEEFIRKTRGMLRELPVEGEHLDELRLGLASQIVVAEERLAVLREQSPDQPPSSQGV